MPTALVRDAMVGRQSGEAWWLVYMPVGDGCSCCALLCWLDEKGAAVMIQIELGGWLKCRIWDGMQLLVRKVGRSLADIRWNIRWNIQCAVRLWRVSVQSTTDV